jgi:hypothetical protein
VFGEGRFELFLSIASFMFVSYYFRYIPESIKVIVYSWLQAMRALLYDVSHRRGVQLNAATVNVIEQQCRKIVNAGQLLL